VSDSKNITPNLFWRLLGFSGGSITVNRNGVSFLINSKKHFIDNHEFLKDGVIKQNAFTCSLLYKTDNGRIEFGKLTRAKAEEVHKWLRSYWYLEVFDEVNKEFLELRKRLTSKYIRTSRWNEIVKDSKDVLSSFIEPPSEGLIPEDKRKPFERIYLYAHYSKNDLTAYRNDFVKKQNEKYSRYFDSVESNPLTQEQREACIIDEDNNLILAGAGTGKTSTMVGRAGYLIQSKQAIPSDILMVAFATKAAEEMRERVCEKIRREDLSVNTFHSLGLEIIAQAEGVKPNVSKYADNGSLLKQDISKWIDEFLLDEAYQAKAIKYFEDYLYVEKSHADFNSLGDYYSYLESDEIRTFKDEKVKGHGERIIANFLFRMGIEYKYEEKYKHQTATLEYSQYKPDFYLPEYDIYIEHFGIDRNGNTAPYIPKKEYHEGMKWKRNLHKQNKTKLIETFFYEHIEGKLRELLKTRLAEYEVVCTPIPDEALIKTLGESQHITNFSELMFNILKRFRANCFDASKLEEIIKNTQYPKHLSIALELLEPIKNRYESILLEAKEIDFEDMIAKAINYVETDKFKPKWKYIMVDEFQDISDARARLIKLLKGKHSDCSLFCVGDDWQSIYRFTGSDIGFTRGFAKYFGSSQISKLQHTFRFNNSIADISSAFILKNKLQTIKEITSTKIVSSPKVSLLRQSSRCDDKTASREVELLTQGHNEVHSSYIRGRYLQLNKVLSKIYTDKNDASVLILGRYSYTFDKSEIEIHKKSFPSLKLMPSTAHSSKGREADYVIVMGLQSGKDGFPSEKTTHPLLDALLPVEEDFEFAEERRLFYVALTRARYKTYLVCDMTIASRFVSELIGEDDYEIELNEFDIAKSQEAASELHCVKCQTGVLQQKTNRSSGERFYGCSHWSLCDYTEAGCASCGEVMIRVSEDNMRNGGFRICTACNTWVAVCPQCKSDMKVRVNSQTNKEFFGCKKYPFCTYTENLITPPTIINKKSRPRRGEVVEKKEALQFESFKLAAEYARELAMKEKIIPRVVKDDNGRTYSVKVN